MVTLAKNPAYHSALNTLKSGYNTLFRSVWPRRSSTWRSSLWPTISWMLWRDVFLWINFDHYGCKVVKIIFPKFTFSIFAFANYIAMSNVLAMTIVLSWHEVSNQRKTKRINDWLAREKARRQGDKSMTCSWHNGESVLAKCTSSKKEIKTWFLTKLG